MKYKILLKNGVGSPFGCTMELEKVPGMELLEVTKEQLQTILAGQGAELVDYKEELKQEVSDTSPGRGWVKNSKGNWVRKTGAEKQTKKTKSAPVSDTSRGASTGDTHDSTGNS